MSHEQLNMAHEGCAKHLHSQKSLIDLLIKGVRMEERGKEEWKGGGRKSKRKGEGKGKEKEEREKEEKGGRKRKKEGEGERGEGKGRG